MTGDLGKAFTMLETADESIQEAIRTLGVVQDAVVLSSLITAAAAGESALECLIASGNTEAANDCAIGLAQVKQAIVWMKLGERENALAALGMR